MMPSGCSTSADEQMLGLDLRMVRLLRELIARGDRLARFFGVLVDVHGARDPRCPIQSQLQINRKSKI